MLCAVDVHYSNAAARAAAVVFSAWESERADHEVVVDIDRVEPYVPGDFYRRELPCIAAVLERVHAELRVILVDGYVWLDAEGTPGLGAHLYRMRGEAAAVIGVAKSSYAGSPHARRVLRGTSLRPLYLTAAGIDLDEAAAQVAAMHGPHRIPTLLARVDRLCRR